MCGCHHVLACTHVTLKALPTHHLSRNHYQIHASSHAPSPLSQTVEIIDIVPIHSKISLHDQSLLTSIKQVITESSNEPGLQVGHHFWIRFWAIGRSNLTKMRSGFHVNILSSRIYFEKIQNVRWWPYPYWVQLPVRLRCVPGNNVFDELWQKALIAFWSFSKISVRRGTSFYVYGCSR